METGFCQPGRKSCARLEPSGTRCWHRLDQPPTPSRVGKLRHGAATTNTGVRFGNCIQCFLEQSHPHPSPSLAFPALRVQLQLLSWLCRVKWGSHRWGIGAFGCRGTVAPLSPEVVAAPPAFPRGDSGPRLSPRAASPLINRLQVASVTIETGAVS